MRYKLSYVLCFTTCFTCEIIFFFFFLSFRYFSGNIYSCTSSKRNKIGKIKKAHTLGCRLVLTENANIPFLYFALTGPQMLSHVYISFVPLTKNQIQYFRRKKKKKRTSTWRAQGNLPLPVAKENWYSFRHVPVLL